MKRVFLLLLVFTALTAPAFSQRYKGRFKADIKTEVDHYRGRLIIGLTDSSLTILEPVRRGLFRVITTEKTFTSKEIRSIRIFRRSGPILGAVAGYVILGLGGAVAGAAIADNGQADLNNILNIVGGLMLGSSVGSVAGGVGGVFTGKAIATKYKNRNVNASDFPQIRIKMSLL